MPGQLDNDKTAETKLTNLLRHLRTNSTSDPDSKLRGRVKPVTSVGQVAGKAPQKLLNNTTSGKTKPERHTSGVLSLTMITQDEQTASVRAVKG